MWFCRHKASLHLLPPVHLVQAQVSLRLSVTLSKTRLGITTCANTRRHYPLHCYTGATRNASLAKTLLAIAAADIVVILVLFPTLTVQIPPRSHRSKHIETGASSRVDCLILQVALWRNAPRDSYRSIYLAIGCHETEKACRMFVMQKFNLSF